MTVGIGRHHPLQLLELRLHGRQGSLQLVGGDAQELVAQLQRPVRLLEGLLRGLAGPTLLDEQAIPLGLRQAPRRHVTEAPHPADDLVSQALGPGEALEDATVLEVDLIRALLLGVLVEVLHPGVERLGIHHLLVRERQQRVLHPRSRGGRSGFPTARRSAGSSTMMRPLRSTTSRPSAVDSSEECSRERECASSRVRSATRRSRFWRSCSRSSSRQVALLDGGGQAEGDGGEHHDPRLELEEDRGEHLLRSRQQPEGR